MIFLLGALGFVISLYAINVEKNAILKKKSLCDINDNISCSRVLTSPYAKMVGKIFKLNSKHPLNLPNTYYGVIFYICIMLYSIYPFTAIPYHESLLLIGSSMSLIASFGLIYILIFELKDICIVCLGTHLVNVIIFILALKENSLL